ncbi:hypothetical protein Pmani_018473 [Petrolisthes manimaculis]|uniref:SOCS box domain-containing protein n=1 Tax=Petrolisthes manimaculis TaxID=1843537 RepID=A0AAE1PK79_9EUCA|nr:hypothetical protein Pmani_018473 [Petrolisthes manimaculis]
MAEASSLPPQMSPHEYMMNLMVDGDDDEDVRLHLAALCGDDQGLKEILADPNASEWINYRVRPYLSPPLRLAVSGMKSESDGGDDVCCGAGGSEECVRALVAAGADIEMEDVKGQTSIFVATSQRKPEIMKILLEAGAYPEGSRKNRCTPLLVAVRDGFTQGVRLLLQYGADPEPCEQIVTCIPGWPLHHSVVYAHFPCFFELLKAGATPCLSTLPCQVNEKVVARLSIPHAILKYAREHPEFMELYYECGGYLRQLNQAGMSGLEESENSPAKKMLIKLIGMPLSLKSLCRLVIRKNLGREKLTDLASLEIPASLIPFLNFEEFSRYSLRSKETTLHEIPCKIDSSN